MAANFDCGKFKLYVFIDLSKGFDTVNFTEKKMKYYDVNERTLA